MKKLHSLVCSAIILSALFALSGCGGGSSSPSSSSFNQNDEATYEVVQSALLSSPAFEVNKSYRIYVSSDLSGMDGNRYYIANIGSKATQAAFNLGFSEEIGNNNTLAVVDNATGSVVFAYDPHGVNNTAKHGGTVNRTGGSLLRYRNLAISGINTASFDIVGHLPVYVQTNPQNTNSGANLINAVISSDIGITSIKMGTGTGAGFLMSDDLYYEPRGIPSSGNVYRLVRKVNTFSDIIIVR